jgi:alpha-mannosidase
MKAAFPVNVLNTEATFEAAHGAIKRPTHRNSSFDAARFEQCAHKWADLSEGDYGVSILNDCKYGYDILDSTMRITLLRAPTCPDRKGDLGYHKFTYAFYPHSGT